MGLKSIVKVRYINANKYQECFIADIKRKTSSIKLAFSTTRVHRLNDLQGLVNKNCVTRAISLLKIVFQNQYSLILIFQGALKFSKKHSCRCSVNKYRKFSYCRRGNNTVYNKQNGRNSNSIVYI